MNSLFAQIFDVNVGFKLYKEKGILIWYSHCILKAACKNNECDLFKAVDYTNNNMDVHVWVM